jgi:light-regulated signal transduction histidine kinase (bacteriophytochrome)
MRDYTDYRGSIEENEKKLWNKSKSSKLDFNYDELIGYKKEILRSLIMRNLKEKGNLKVLDISTNKGFFAMLMAEERHDVVAIDSDINAINNCKNRADKENLKILVKDRGSGISPNVIDKLFKSMVTNKGTMGTGLGLYISNAVIRGKFNGEMWGENREGGGSIFGISIPIELVHIRKN